jgi:chloride channel protein, CIC family
MHVVTGGQPDRAEPSRTTTWLVFLLSVVAGALAGGAGAALMMVLRVVEHLAWNAQGDEVVSAARAVPPARHVVVMATAGCVVALGVPLVRRIARGSIDLEEAIWRKGGQLPFLASILKSTLSIVVVGLGAAVGREAALQQTGGAIGSALATRTRSVVSTLRQEDVRLVTAAGAAAGFAAAYNVPLGGAAFALEVLVGSISFETVAPILATSIVGMRVSHLFLPGGPVYRLPDLETSPSHIAFAVVIAPLVALAAALFIKVVAAAHGYQSGGVIMRLSAVLVLALLGVASVWVPEILGNGQDLIRELLDHHLALALVAVLPLIRLAATGSSLLVKTPGGLFTPCLCIGAALAATVGSVWATFWPGQDVAGYAVIGSGAMVAAAMNAPIAATLLVHELTNTHLDAPVALAAVLASLIARQLEPRTMYSARITQ